MHSDQHPTPHSVRLIRSLVLAVCLVALGAALGFCQQPRDQVVHSVGWVSSWDEAIERSTNSGLPVMLMFTGSDWCPWSQKLQREVLNSAEFAAWSHRVVLIEVDFPKHVQLPDRTERQNDVLKEWYGEFVTGFPTALFVMPDGHVIGTIGYVEGGPNTWIKRANEVLIESSDKTASVDRPVMQIAQTGMTKIR